MKKLIALLPMLFLACLLHAQDTEQKAPREFVMEEEGETYTMKSYTMILLYRGDQAGDYSREELIEMQNGHMANINRLAKEGKILMAGPMGEDEDLRGIFILDTDSKEQALEWVADDPAIKAGRLRAEAHVWWTAKGGTLN